MSEVYAVTGRVFYGSITKAYDSAFTDGTELLGAQDREHRLTIYSTGRNFREPNAEASPRPGLGHAVMFELEIDTRGLDAATVALFMDEIDTSSGTGVQTMAGTPITGEQPTTKLIIRPLKHSVTARYVFGPRWCKDKRKSNFRVVYGPEGPHLSGSRLVLRACAAITRTTAAVDHPAAAWTTSAVLLTAYENMLAGT